MSRPRLAPTAARLAIAAAFVAPALPANVLPASADTAVREYAETAFYLGGRDGADYRVYVAGFGPDEVDARPSTAVIQILRCTGRATTTCTTVTNARIAIPASAFTVGADLSSAKLTTSIRGVPLTVTWQATGDPAVVPGLQAWLTPTVRVGPQRQARATVEFLGARCRNVFGVVSHEVTVSTNDLHAPTTGGIPDALRGSPAPRCTG